MATTDHPTGPSLTAGVQDRHAALEDVFSALAHSSRRHILLVISFRGGMMTAGEIAERFHHKWPTISRHLRVLERAGLLSHQKRGRTRVYRVNPAKLDLVREWLGGFDRDGERIG